MEQLFTLHPNYFADQFQKASKPENSIIDKYLESRMKVHAVGKSTDKSLSLLKSQKNSNNLKQERIGNCETNFKSTPARLANKKASTILQNMNKNSSNSQGFASSNIHCVSNEFYNIHNQNSATLSDHRKDEPDDDDSEFAGNSKDSTQHDHNTLGKEEFVREHRYESAKELEKSDEKESASMKDSEDRTSWDINERVARILKLVQSDVKNDGGQQEFSKCGTSKEGLGGSTNVDIWAGQDNRYSYYVFLVMLVTIALGSLMSSADRLLEKIKVFFDVIFINCWKWMKGIVAPSNNNEGNLFLFVLCTPIFVFLLIIYSGFTIVYYSNKAMLSRVPNKIAKQVNLKKIKELTT